MTTLPSLVTECPFITADSVITAEPPDLVVDLYPATSEQSTDDVHEQDDHHENQRGRPRQLDLVLEWHSGEVVDEDGQRGRRLHEPEGSLLDQPEAAEQRGEQQRRRLAGRPRD